MPTERPARNLRTINYNRLSDVDSDYSATHLNDTINAAIEDFLTVPEILPRINQTPPRLFHQVQITFNIISHNSITPLDFEEIQSLFSEGVIIPLLQIQEFPRARLTEDEVIRLCTDQGRDHSLVTGQETFDTIPIIDEEEEDNA